MCSFFFPIFVPNRYLHWYLQERRKKIKSRYRHRVNEQNRDGRDDSEWSRMLNGWRQPTHSLTPWWLLLPGGTHSYSERGSARRTMRVHTNTTKEGRHVCGQRRRRQNVQRIGRDDVVLECVYKTGSAIGRIDPSPWMFLATCPSRV